MALQSLLAKAGLRTSTLGTLASLALAFPLSEGDPSTAAHTAASRTGLYATAGAKVATVVNGVEALSVLATGVVVPGTLSVGGVTYTWPGANAVGALTNNGAGVLSWTPVATISSNIQSPQIAYATGLNALTGDPNLVYTGLQVGIGTSAPAAKLDVVGTDLTTSANLAVSSLFTHGTLTKNDANVRQFFGALLKPVFNTGGANTNTTFNVLQVDTVNTSLTGLTVNLLNLAFGGVNRFNVASGGAVTIPSTSLSIGGVTYVWPALQGGANAIFQNDGSGNLSWNVMSGDATLNGTGVLTLATVLAAGGPVGSGTVAPVITWDAKGRLTAVSSANITAAGIGAIGGSIAQPQIAFGAATANTIAGDANFVYTSTNLGLGTASPATKLSIVGNDLAAAADQSIADISTQTALTKNSVAARTFYSVLLKPTFNTGGSNTSTTFNILATDAVATSVTGLTVNLLSLNYGGVNQFLVDSTGKTTLPRNGTGTGDYTFGLTGTPVANATSSQVRIGSALVGGNAAANGGTYFGINSPASGAGSTADLVNLQSNGTPALQVTQTTTGTLTRVNNAGNDSGGSIAALSVANTAGSGGPALYLDGSANNNGVLILRSQGITGAAQVVAIRNISHSAIFTFIIGSLGAMAWGTGDANRDTQLSRVGVSTLQIDNLAGGAGNLLVTGQVGFGTTSLAATATMNIVGANLSTAADQSVATISGTSTISKNDSNTRTFYGNLWKPTLNTGASNLNTTMNILAVDTVNTVTTGLTVNLLNLAYGGQTIFTIAGKNSGTLVFGANSSVNAGSSESVAMGNQSRVLSSAGSTNVAIGDNCTVSGTTTASAYAIGERNNATANNAWALGTSCTSSAPGALTFGNGILFGNILTNNTTNAFIFGQGLTTPTLYARGGATYTGAGTVATSNVTQTVTGTGTTFLVDYVKGDRITVGANTYQVTAIASNLSLTISTVGAVTVSGSAYTVVPCMFKLIDNTATTQMIVSDTGLVGLGTGDTLPVTRLEIVGLDLTTSADQSVASIYSHTTLSKNDTNVRTFYSELVKPTFNTGGSNTNTTYNVLAVDTVNTSVTGLTVNLLNLAFGGSTQATVLSDGSFSATNIQTKPNRAILGTVDLGYPNQAGTVVIATGSANQAGDAGTIILGNGAVQSQNACQQAILMGATIALQSSGGYHFNNYALGYNITILNADSTWTIGGGVSSGSRLVPHASNTINFGINSTVPTLWIGAGSGAGTYGSLNMDGRNFNIGTVTYVWPASQGGASTVLTNDGAGNLSWAAAGGGGTIGGSIAANQVAYGLGSNTIQGSANLTYDGTTLTANSPIVSTFAAAASTPPVAITGTWFSGGSATTTKPQMLIEVSGVTSTGWSTAGTGLGVNGASAFIGNLLDLQLNGVTKFHVDYQGNTTVQGRLFADVNGAASAPAILVPGTWFTGGSTTTTKPQLLIEPSGATSTAWSTSGTGLGVNAASGFVGNLIDLQLNGVSKFKVTSTGATTIVSTSLSIGTVAYVWPSSQGGANTVLSNDGAGNLSWAAGGGTIGGSIATNQVAYGSGSNTIQGVSALTFDGSQLTVGGNVNVNTTTFTINPTTTGSIASLTGLHMSLGGASGATSVFCVDLAINFGSSPTTVYGLRFQPAGSLGSLTTAYFLYSTNRVFSNYWQGSTIIEHDQGASDPQVRVQGTWFSAGTATTNKPQLLVEPLAATSTGWNTNGTGLGVNAATGFTGMLLDLQKNGVSFFSVDAFGGTIIQGALTAISGQSFGGTCLMSGLADAAISTNATSWVDTGSSTINDNSLTILNTNTAPLSSYTVTMPANPNPGQIQIIASAGAITAFTLSPNGGQSIQNAPVAFVADTSFSFIFFSGVWYRLF